MGDRTLISYAALMFGKRKDARPSDDAFLALLHKKVAAEEPVLLKQASIRKGILVGGQGWSVMVLPATHSNNPNHYDLGFVLNLEAKDRVIVDCVQGFGTPAQAIDNVLHIWRETSGACFLELLTMRGEYATHFDGDDSSGITGWHTVASGVIAYGSDDATNNRMQSAMLDNKVMRALSGSIVPSLDPGSANGIKFFYIRAANQSVTAEVRINGQVDEEATEALIALDWPDVNHGSAVRCYAVALHPES